MKVAVIQLNIDDGDKESRIEHVEELLDTTANADLILLPELWNVGYFSFDLYQSQSEPLTGETVRRIQKKAVKLGAYIMAGSIVEQCGDRLYNTSVLIAPDGSISGTYQKRHLFGLDSDESRLLTAGKKHGAIQTAIGTFGLSTCFDLRFPELYRQMLDYGTEMYLIASAWPDSRLEHWKILTRARAIENQAFVAAANCSGNNRGRIYGGNSVILDPTGKVLAEADRGEEIILAEIDLGHAKRTRASFPSVSVRTVK